jgi:hypothetical protein
LRLGECLLSVDNIIVRETNPNILTSNNTLLISNPLHHSVLADKSLDSIPKWFQITHQNFAVLV